MSGIKTAVEFLEPMTDVFNLTGGILKKYTADILKVARTASYNFVNNEVLKRGKSDLHISNRHAPHTLQGLPLVLRMGKNQVDPQA